MLKKFWTQKILGQRKFDPKNFGSQRICVEIKFWIKNIFWSKEYVIQEEFSAQDNFGSK